MFNTQGYTPERSQTLANGIYDFIIRSATEKTNASGSYVEIEVQARGKKGWSPNKIFYNEAPKVGTYKKNGQPVTEDDLKRWNRELTTFFDSFGITPGNFNFSTWVGKIGRCKVAEQYDPNEADKKSKKFKAIYPQILETTEQPMQQPQAESIPSSIQFTAAQEYQPAPEYEQPPIFNEQEIKF